MRSIRFLPTVAVLAPLVLALAPAFGQEASAGATARIIFYRYKQFAGSGLEPSIYCDEVQLARMDNGRYVVVQLPVGRHTCRSNDKQSGVELELRPGQDYFIRVEIATGFWKGHGRLVVTAPEQAAYEVRKLKPLGPDKIMDKQRVVGGEYQPAAQPPAAQTPAAASAEAAALTNADIIKLKAAGLSDELIIRKIRDSRVDFRLEPDNLVELKTANISESVIGAMMEAAKKR